ncbi:hypothetical protein GCM10009797_35560 [Nocardioides hwasunensis]
MAGEQTTSHDEGYAVEQGEKEDQPDPVERPRPDRHPHPPCDAERRRRNMTLKSGVRTNPGRFVRTP